jgi:hypothetical protein
VSPRAREEIVRPRLQSGSCARPLNFSVRRQMNAVPTFDLAVTYDDASLRAAARVLFARLWRWMLPWTAGAMGSLLLVAILLWYFRQSTLIWYLAAFALANVCMWAYTRWNIQRRLMKRLSKSAQIRLTAIDFSIASAGESHTFPWARFKSTSTDEHNLYLFLTKTAAFVLPIREVPSEALQFVIAHVGAHATAV